MAYFVTGATGFIGRFLVQELLDNREGDVFVVELDIPGVSTDAIDLDVERNVLTVKAERPGRQDDSSTLTSERPRGIFSRQLVLGDNLDLDRVEASYETGVLKLRIPVAEKAKPRKIEVTTSGSDRQAIEA